MPAGRETVVIGAIAGAGNPNRLAVWSAADTIGDSYLFQTAGAVTVDDGKVLASADEVVKVDFDSGASLKLITPSLDLTASTVIKTSLSAFDDDAAAGVGGLVAGDLYQTTGLGAAPLDAAGIVMVKQ
jgi:hypothetical protein